MAKIWAMKTYKAWMRSFVAEGVIGIDHAGLDKAVTSYTPAALKKVFQGTARPERREGFFKVWANEVEEGDLIVLGTGQTTKFNAVALAVVAGGYQFDATRDPDIDATVRAARHIHVVNLRIFREPIAMGWNWVPRLTEIDPSKMGEFVELIAKLVAAGEIGALPLNAAAVGERQSKDYLQDLLDDEAHEQLKDLFKDLYIPNGNSGMATELLVMRNRNGDIRVSIYSEDGTPHKEPHYHIWTNQWAVVVSIRSNTVLAGEFPKGTKYEKEFFKWADAVRPQLVKGWDDALAGRQVKKISKQAL